MLNFRCRVHRDDHQELWQVARTDDGRAGREIVGSFRDGNQRPGGWIREKRELADGLYCQRCIIDGSIDPLPDYDLRDLEDAGLLDVPHIGLGADDFDLHAVWRSFNERFGDLIVATRDREPQPARCDDSLADDPRIYSGVRRSLRRVLGDRQLYTHQVKAIDASLNGRDIVIETATASGKSLCYWVPILNALSEDDDATALYVSPLNALGEDQLQAVDCLGTHPTVSSKLGSLEQFARQVEIGSHSVFVARYDGTVPGGIRQSIRKRRPQVMITNPEMLHRGILPWHGKHWTHFISSLQFIVLDELHVYKGMFGANFANILRRLLRLAAHYDRRPQIIACSASIGNPEELFGLVTGRRKPAVITAAENGAPQLPQKQAILDLTRGSDAMPTLMKDILVQAIGVQRARTIAFMRSISEVDQVFRYVGGELSRSIKGISKKTVRQYKREIPPLEKAAVTADLRNGATLGVISTTALQLGIDIGDLSVCAISKFPGSKAAFFQQAGRVGRTGSSIVFLIADESPLDQHFVLRPEELLDSKAEVVYLNPDHPDVVLPHLRCAAEELPIDELRDGEFYGRGLSSLLKVLAERKDMKADGREVLVVETRGKAAAEVNIRALGFECIVRDEAGTEVAKPDVLRAMRRFHKYARFQIQDQAYEVTKLYLDWKQKHAEATARRLDRLDYSTASLIQTECSPIVPTEEYHLKDGLGFVRGSVRFKIGVESYYRIPVGSGEPEYQGLGVAAPPHYELDTHGFWFSIPREYFSDVPSKDVSAAAYSAMNAMRIAAALLCSTDPDDLGTYLDNESTSTGVRFYVADTEPGGNGLTEQVFFRPLELLDATLRILKDCPNCSSDETSRGCPRCVTTPWGDDSSVCRNGAISILKKIREQMEGPVDRVRLAMDGERPGTEF